MARSKENGNNIDKKVDTGGAKTGWNGSDKPVFIEGYLDATDKEWLQANSDQSLEHIATLIDGIADEYSVSCKFDTTSQRFIASLTCRVKNHPNSGCILVSRGSTPVNALYALSYRHFFKFGEDWRSSGATNSGDWD